MDTGDSTSLVQTDLHLLLQEEWKGHEDGGFPALVGDRDGTWKASLLRSWSPHPPSATLYAAGAFSPNALCDPALTKHLRAQQCPQTLTAETHSIVPEYRSP